MMPRLQKRYVSTITSPQKIVDVKSELCIKMKYQVFTSFTCQSAFSIDIEERIFGTFDTKNLQFPQIECLFFAIQ